MKIEGKDSINVLFLLTNFEEVFKVTDDMSAPKKLYNRMMLYIWEDISNDVMKNMKEAVKRGYIK